MKYVPTIAGALLGLMFVAFSTLFFLKLVPTPEFPEGSPIAMMMGAFGPTGYMAFVKALELIGGLLVAIPVTRNLGLLVLGPIIVNIIAFHVFITQGAGLFEPTLIAIVVLATFLLWCERKAFGYLITRPRGGGAA